MIIYNIFYVPLALGACRRNALACNIDMEPVDLGLSLHRLRRPLPCRPLLAAAVLLALVLERPVQWLATLRVFFFYIFVFQDFFFCFLDIWFYVRNVFFCYLCFDLRDFYFFKKGFYGQKRKVLANFENSLIFYLFCINFVSNWLAMKTIKQFFFFGDFSDN